MRTVREIPLCASAALVVMAFVLNAVLSSAGSVAATQEPTDPAQSTTGLDPAAPGPDVLDPTIVGEQKLIAGVPSYMWYYGCGPTAAGMLIGYWDGLPGFEDLVPGDVRYQNESADSMIASYEHITDYAFPLDDYRTGILPDLSSTGGAHQDNCLADWMRTSWSVDGSYFGWSYFDKVDDALVGYTAFSAPEYAAKCTQVYGKDMTWELLTTEINESHPLVLLVDSNGDGITDHFVTAIGYGTQYGLRWYACFDTWYSNVRWCQFLPMSKGVYFGVYGATLFELTLSGVPSVLLKTSLSTGSSTSTWTYSPPANGHWQSNIENHGLKGLTIIVKDVTGSEKIEVSRTKVSFTLAAAYPDGFVLSAPTLMEYGHVYEITARDPDGLRTGCAIMFDTFLSGG